MFFFFPVQGPHYLTLPTSGHIYSISTTKLCSPSLFSQRTHRARTDKPDQTRPDLTCSSSDFLEPHLYNLFLFLTRSPSLFTPLFRLILSTSIITHLHNVSLLEMALRQWCENVSNVSKSISQNLSFSVKLVYLLTIEPAV